MPAAQTWLPSKLAQELEQIASVFDKDVTLADLMAIQQQCG